MLPHRSACALTVRTEGRVTTLRFLGDKIRLDHEAVLRLAPQLCGLAGCCGSRELVLDFRNVWSIGSAGLRLLLRLHRRMRRAGGGVRLHNVLPCVAEVFAVTKVGRLFGLRATARLKDGWLFAQGDTLAGPVTTAELRRLVAQQHLSPDATVWRAHHLHPSRTARVLADC